MTYCAPYLLTSNNSKHMRHAIHDPAILEKHCVRHCSDITPELFYELMNSTELLLEIKKYQLKVNDLEEQIKNITIEHEKYSTLSAELNKAKEKLAELQKLQGCTSNEALVKSENHADSANQKDLEIAVLKQELHNAQKQLQKVNAQDVEMAFLKAKLAGSQTHCSSEERTESDKKTVSLHNGRIYYLNIESSVMVLSRSDINQHNTNIAVVNALYQQLYTAFSTASGLHRRHVTLYNNLITHLKDYTPSRRGQPNPMVHNAEDYSGMHAWGRYFSNNPLQQIPQPQPLPPSPGPAPTINIIDNRFTTMISKAGSIVVSVKSIYKTVKCVKSFWEDSYDLDSCKDAALYAGISLAPILFPKAYIGLSLLPAIDLGLNSMSNNSHLSFDNVLMTGLIPLQQFLPNNVKNIADPMFIVLEVYNLGLEVYNDVTEFGLTGNNIQNEALDL